ncbi:hypoxanthine/guanine phosphoribosyltransferase [[Eubacterium] cellulosolvens]
MEHLRTSLEESPIVKKGEYNYFIHPITDGVPEVEPDLLREVVSEIRNLLTKEFDKLVAIEAMGLPIGAALAVDVKKPLVIIRKKSYGLEGEVAVEQVTGYSKAKLFINGLEPHDKVVIVDDVISTGGTLKAVLTALNDMGVDVVDAIVVIEKGENKAGVERETGIEIKALVKVDIVDEKVVIIEE